MAHTINFNPETSTEEEKNCPLGDIHYTGEIGCGGVEKFIRNSENY